MKVLIVYAHPEPLSLNGSLKNSAVRILQENGHEVVVSDLYQMQWKAAADENDFSSYTPGNRLFYSREAREALANGTLSAAVMTEQEKIRWADTILFVFPLWWFSMPAIMKGWVDRVFSAGFAYGIKQRYGIGNLSGKKVMLMVTTGGMEENYLEKGGINGSMSDLLFHIHHGICWFTGAASLPPFVVYSADRLTEDKYPAVETALEERLLTMDTTPVLPFRYSNSGDYDEKDVLLPHLAAGKQGFALHLREELPLQEMIDTDTAAAIDEQRK
ncbi:NAD(P)H-dependent oxidoreductase [Chitinophaga solisilvae]|uniref:NAD(P)H-dependent oxidoreductase n=1 Tax=Chitinophaga solisilvae TaxID=1233460 RepID=A0A433WJE7_9BACT|nr:NAD(P)H-dependent oxidoreductase [Chitinophaga solisilvae]NSL87889.1 NAD(P)H-dependent oxidoreductase [Chitinophaga solisilvae]